MNNEPRQKLCKMINEYGYSICDDPHRCENLLKEQCGQYKREIFVLIGALYSKVAEDLLKSSDIMTHSFLIRELQKRLENELAMSTDAAQWAVESWAIALGKITPIAEAYQLTVIVVLDSGEKCIFLLVMVDDKPKQLVLDLKNKDDRHLTHVFDTKSNDPLTWEQVYDWLYEFMDIKTSAQKEEGDKIVYRLRNYIETKVEHQFPGFKVSVSIEKLFNKLELSDNDISNLLGYDHKINYKNSMSNNQQNIKLSLMKKYLVCPKCESQDSYDISDSNYLECPACRTKFEVYLFKIRAKRSQGNRSKNRRKFSVRVIDFTGRENLIEFISHGYNDFELRSGDLAVFSYINKNLRLIQNFSITQYMTISSPNYLYTRKLIIGGIIIIIIIIGLLANSNTPQSSNPESAQQQNQSQRLNPAPVQPSNQILNSADAFVTTMGLNIRDIQGEKTGLIYKCGDRIRTVSGISTNRMTEVILDDGQHAYLASKFLSTQKPLQCEIAINVAANAYNSGEFEPEMMAIAGGCFQMGSPVNEPDRSDNENQHQVCVNSFGIGRYEVTQRQWQALMDSNPSYFKNCLDCPVEQVSWNDVQDYLRKLNQQTGKNYRLPTEVEWEYACRGGTAGQIYCGGDSPDRLAWYNGNSGDNTHPVGQKAANGFGLRDMSGNIWEWTCSAYDKDYGDTDKVCTNNSAGGPLSVRGGSWGSEPARVRSTYRFGGDPAARGSGVGFRLARSL